MDLERIEITSLPEGLNVDGNLYLYESSITSLPKGLKVRGLFLAYSRIKSLPEDLEVEGLDLGGTEITKLPKGLKVDYNLVLRNCKNLKSLPKGLIVGGDLHVYGTSIYKLDDDEIAKMIYPGYINGSIY